MNDPLAEVERYAELCGIELADAVMELVNEGINPSDLVPLCAQCQKKPVAHKLDNKGNPTRFLRKYCSDECLWEPNRDTVRLAKADFRPMIWINDAGTN